MKFYNANLSPNAFRARAVINELGLEPEIIDINLGKGENRTPEFLALNPNGKVPVLVDGDAVIWESRAIGAYLGSKLPERDLYPADLVRRAHVDQWSYWQAIHFGPAMQKVNFERVQKKLFGRGEPDDTAITADLKTLDDLLPVLDAALAGREWIVDRLTIADLIVASTFVLRAPARLGIERYRNVDRWIAGIEALPSWQKTVAPYLAGLKGFGLELA
jgi:glutathione S-transferase